MAAATAKRNGLVAGIAAERAAWRLSASPTALRRCSGRDVDLADVTASQVRAAYLTEVRASPLTVPASQSTHCVPDNMDAEDPLFILYTSGSTGKPKVDRPSAGLHGPQATHLSARRRLLPGCAAHPSRLHGVLWHRFQVYFRPPARRRVLLHSGHGLDHWAHICIHSSRIAAAARPR